VTGVHIEGRTREGGGTSPRWTTAARPSSTGYTRELEPGHLGRAKSAKATELQAPCVQELMMVKVMLITRIGVRYMR
jgi:hypothetical protein